MVAYSEPMATTAGSTASDGGEERDHQGLF